jgi:hypothetical protein
MPLPIEILEGFFGEKFHFEQRMGELAHFDGYAYWHLLLIPEDGQFLNIMAGESATSEAFPTVEVGGCYTDDIKVVPLSGNCGTALILRPEGHSDDRNCVVITKTRKGRLSLSTTVGQRQERTSG